MIYMNRARYAIYFAPILMIASRFSLAVGSGAASLIEDETFLESEKSLSWVQAQQAGGKFNKALNVISLPLTDEHHAFKR